jgi:hypothetical protein
VGSATGQLQAAVDVVREGRRDERQGQHHRHEADHEAQPRQGEDEEAHVEAELRVLDAERLAVGPEQEGAPRAHRPGTGEQAEDDRDGHHADAAQRLDGLAVLLEHLLGRGDRDVQRTGAVGDDQAGGHHAPGDDRGPREDRELGRQLLDEHAAEADRVVPPHVGEQVGDDAADDDDTQQDEQGGAERAPPAARGRARRPATTLVGPLRAWRTFSWTRRSVEPLRATHCSPRPAVGNPPCRPWASNVPRPPARPSGTMVR